MKTTIRLFFMTILLAPTFVRAESLESSAAPFSVRVRPMALAYGILGAEAYYQTESGYYIGLTAHWFDATNDDKNTSLNTDEFGLKLGKFFGENTRASGFWVEGALNFNHTLVSNFYPITQQNLTATFNQFSEVLSVGYQFRVTFIDPDRLNIRLGAGIDYKPAADVQRVVATNGASVPIGVRKRLDPTLEFTLGYLL